MESKLDLIRELGPYAALAAGVLLALHGKPDAGLITGSFALIQVVNRRPTGGSKADPEVK